MTAGLPTALSHHLRKRLRLEDTLKTSQIHPRHLKLLRDEILYRDEAYFLACAVVPAGQPQVTQAWTEGSQGSEVVRAEKLETKKDRSEDNKADPEEEAEEELKPLQKDLRLPKEEHTRPDNTRLNNTRLDNSKPKHTMTTSTLPPSEEEEDTGPLVPCKICSRSFASTRVAKHVEVCQKTTAKTRPVYDVALARIVGTEAEELVTNGRIKLEPAKPLEKKSVLMKKYNLEQDKDNADKPDPKKENKEPNKGAKVAQGKNGEAYQVLFDDKTDKMKTRKPQTGIQHSKLPAQVVRGTTTTSKDLRYLSAANSWKRAGKRGSPSLSDFNSSYSDEDYDFLASSMTSQKTVCSDAFDFLFDEKNLNPEKVLENGFATENPSQYNFPMGDRSQVVTQSSCCVVS